MIGGSGEDAIDTAGGDDVVIGDNGAIDRDGNRTTDAGTGGDDRITTGGGTDVVFGGDGSDVIDSGDANDIVVGDNGLLDANGVRSSDADEGAADQITTGDGGDYVIGGAGADVISLGSGNDLAIGDNGAFDWVVGLLRARTTDPELGAGDFIDLGIGGDGVLGGAGGDVITDADGNKIVIGDNGQITFLNGVLWLVTTSDPTDGGDDTITVGDGNDIVFGGTGADTINTAGGNDLVFGDHGFVAGLISADRLPGVAYLALFTWRSIDTGIDDGGAADVIDTGAGDDVVIGGQGGDRITTGAGDDDIIGGHNVPGGATAPTSSTAAPATTGSPATTPRSGAPAATSACASARCWAIRSTTRTARPSSAPAGRVTRTRRTRSARSPCSTTRRRTPAGTWGDDNIAGGAGDDVIFGQLGADWIQGDGSTSIDVTRHRALDRGLRRSAAPTARTGSRATAATTSIFGGLGQDDLIGGSSDLYSLTIPDLRPNGLDTIFGGAGTQLGYNTWGDESADGHARDADVILGDNGNIFSLVGVIGGDPHLLPALQLRQLRRRPADHPAGASSSSTTRSAAPRPTRAATT